MTTTCDYCGRVEDDAAVLLTWSTARVGDRSETYCEQCSRAHLRSMEGKLDPEYW